MSHNGMTFIIVTVAEIRPGCHAQYVNYIEVRLVELIGGLWVAVVYICRRMFLVLGVCLLGRVATTTTQGKVLTVYYNFVPVFLN